MPLHGCFRGGPTDGLANSRRCFEAVNLGPSFRGDALASKSRGSGFALRAPRNDGGNMGRSSQRLVIRPMPVVLRRRDVAILVIVVGVCRRRRRLLSFVVGLFRRSFALFADAN